MWKRISDGFKGGARGYISYICQFTRAGLSTQSIFSMSSYHRPSRKQQRALRMSIDSRALIRQERHHNVHNEVTFAPD